MSSRKRPHGKTIEGGRLQEIRKLINNSHRKNNDHVTVSLPVRPSVRTNTRRNVILPSWIGSPQLNIAYVVVVNQQRLKQGID